MKDLWTIEEVDRDGAIQEAAAKVDPHTRASFLRKAGIGVGAVAGAGVLGGLLPSIAEGATPASDVAILNFALTLEYLEAAFYTEAQSKGRFRGEAGRMARVIGAHERAHVAFLRKALGSAAVAKPKFNFKGTTTNGPKFLQTAQVLEDTGVSAYLGQVTNIKTKAILKAAGTILSVEARHAAWVREVNSTRTNFGPPLPAPAAFDSPKTKAQILAAVKGTGFIVG